jgi:hypothetical protein
VAAFGLRYALLGDLIDDELKNAESAIDAGDDSVVPYYEALQAVSRSYYLVREKHDRLNARATAEEEESVARQVLMALSPSQAPPLGGANPLGARGKPADP